MQTRTLGNECDLGHTGQKPRPNLSHGEINFLAGVTEPPCCRDADFKNSWILTSSVAQGSQLIFRFCLLHGFRYPCPSTLGLKRTNQNKRPSGVVSNLGCNPEVVTVTGGVRVSCLRLKVYLSSGRGQSVVFLNQTSCWKMGNTCRFCFLWSWQNTTTRFLKLGVLPNRKHAKFRFLCQERTQNSTLTVI